MAETTERTQKYEQQKTGGMGRDKEEKEQEKEKQQFNQELNVLEEKAKRLRDSKLSRKCKYPYCAVATLTAVSYVHRQGKRKRGRGRKEFLI